MIISISVIICTHNPRPDYIERVINALKAQTLPLERWELLLIDNASNQSLCEKINLDWHFNARHIRENQLGLTYARLRGFKESQTEVLVFVDDDNVLDQDYLETTLQISEKWPVLGAWGGQILPEFEETPPEWTKPFWINLALREFEHDKWSNLLHQDESTPWGAGLCIRRTVAEKYGELVRNDPNRAKLGRSGKSLLSSEDKDMVFTSCDIGLGTGIFSSLKLTHLIPSNRLQEEYLLKLIEGVGYSSVILDSFRGKSPPNYSLKTRLANYFRRWFLNPRERRFKDASFRGVNSAIQQLRSVKSP